MAKARLTIPKANIVYKIATRIPEIAIVHANNPVYLVKTKMLSSSKLKQTQKHKTYQEAPEQTFVTLKNIIELIINKTIETIFKIPFGEIINSLLENFGLSKSILN